ncbi:DgyrCDS14723 [Dimorphilus gyrociliatus]|uniref:DgyrCDS14723 n=1 Tax=Dimorphilus gyrociliatus TaxID=2664684 RepID=A0A7I8WES2_9ANNE|nr:DgyrCDS14723 [Dimorphilus gyrociliatus]
MFGLSVPPFTLKSKSYGIIAPAFANEIELSLACKMICDAVSKFAVKHKCEKRWANDVTHFISNCQKRKSVKITDCQLTSTLHEVKFYVASPACSKIRNASINFEQAKFQLTNILEEKESIIGEIKMIDSNDYEDTESWFLKYGYQSPLQLSQFCGEFGYDPLYSFIYYKNLVEKVDMVYLNCGDNIIKNCFLSALKNRVFNDKDNLTQISELVEFDQFT